VQPRVEDVDGDGRPDLVAFRAGRGRDPIVFRNQGGLTFAEPVEVTLADRRGDEEIVFLGSLDDSAGAFVVSAEEIEPPEEAGYKPHIEHAKEPDFTYRVRALTADLSPRRDPSGVFFAEGYTFEGSDGGDDDRDGEGDGDDEEADVRLPGGFQDLDGDGRLDLVAITLDFSLVPLVFRALVMGTISLRMDFHPYCQAEDGSFAPVEGLDLSGKFRIDLRKVRIKHLSQFAGDFDGDGRADFVQLGRGRNVTIHQGGPGCTYPVEPDRVLRLAREPLHLGLVRILDLDAAGRSDLYVVHPRKGRSSPESTPVRLDLYLGEPPAVSVRPVTVADRGEAG
jgi:hypothetical protein